VQYGKYGVSHFGGNNQRLVCRASSASAELLVIIRLLAAKVLTRRRSESAYIRQVHDNVIMYTSTRLHTRLPRNVRVGAAAEEAQGALPYTSLTRQS